MALRLVLAGLWATKALGTPLITEHPASAPSGPLNVLQPAVHWDHNKHDLSNLIPSHTASLYYSYSGISHPAIPHQFGHMHSTFNNPTVVLEHSAYIGKVKCSHDGMIIPFTEAAAYATAKQHWPSSGGFFIVSHTARCGQDTSGQRSHWLVKSANDHDGDQTITVVAKEIELEEALEGAHLQYGMYQPQTRSPYGASQTKPRRRDESPESTCGSPPSTTIDGIPATSCGAGFDDRLDSQLGFLKFDTPDEFSASLRQVAPNLDDYEEDDYSLGNLPDDPSTSTIKPRIRARHRRRLPVLSTKLRKAIYGRRRVLLGSLDGLGSTIANAIQQAAKRAADFVVDLTHLEFGPSVYSNLEISAVPKGLVASPFSKAKTDVKIFNTTSKFEGGEAELSAYCVNCGIRGEIHLYGDVLFTLSDGLTSANVNMNGKINGRLVIGIDAHVKYKYEKKKQVFDAGLPGFTIPKIITVGPLVTLDAKFNFDFSAQAQIQAGVEVGIPNFSARLDLVDSSKSGTDGFEPVTTPIFIATGKFQASSTFSTPLSLAIGVNIPLISFKKTVALTEEPGITAMISYASTTPNCLNYSIAFNNRLYLDLFGAKELDLLGPTSLDIVPNTCYALTKRDSLDIEAAASSDRYRTLGGRQDDSGGIVEPYDDSNPDNTEFQDLEAEALEHVQNIENGTSEAEDYGFSYVPIYEASREYLLSNDEDGTVHITPANATSGGVAWQQFGGFITSDISERLIHYHKNEMQTYGVSRLRLADLDTLTTDAALLQLVPASTFGRTPEGEDYYVAADSDENYFFPVTCVYKSGAPSRVFLVRDLLLGPATLARDDLRFTVTGDYVQECLFQGFLTGGS